MLTDFDVRYIEPVRRTRVPDSNVLSYPSLAMTDGERLSGFVTRPRTSPPVTPNMANMLLRRT